MSNESHISVHNEGEVLILEIQETRISEGRILEALSCELEAVLQDRECSKVLLDLHHVELMSSGMVGVLVSFYHELTERNGHFVLSGVRPPVQKVFEITRLDQLFRLEPDVTHGVTHLNK